jgi:hypothetical protein
MTSYLRLFFLCILFICSSSCKEYRKENTWVNTIATITSEKLEDGTYGYTIRYIVSESTAVTSEGRKIEGPIEQHGIAEKKPINNQKIRLRYMKEEPVIFEFIDSMQFEE